MSWRPSSSIEALRARAGMLARARRFFAERDVLEVETPLLSAAATTDPNLHSIACQTAHGPRWLHTSPEFFMKRLLAAGSGPIWQLCKVFRDGEHGRWHNPEFSLLEWYRPGFDQAALMAELIALLRELAPATQDLPVEQVTYRAAFAKALDLNPLTATDREIAQIVQQRDADPTGWSRAEQLDWLMSTAISPTMGKNTLSLLTEFPADQAALARLKPGDNSVALRFELFWRGIELANGFEELVDASEQRRRIEADLAQRQQRGLPSVPADENFLAALAAGMPASSGVAVGLDRLLALTLGARQLSDVLSFDFSRA